jgi:hypothetical protein
VMSAGPSTGKNFEGGKGDYYQAGTLTISSGGFSNFKSVVSAEIRGPVNEVLNGQACSSTSRCYACQGSCLVNSDC